MLDLIEQQLRDKKLEAPRVRPEDLEAEIAAEFCFTASTGAQYGAFYGDRDAFQPLLRKLDLVTICVLVLKNGIKVVGTAACVSAENYDAEIGRNVARRDAVEQLWPLLGFRLADKLRAEKEAPRFRDAETGEFVTAEYAAANPATTVRES